MAKTNYITFNAKNKLITNVEPVTMNSEPIKSRLENIFAVHLITDYVGTPI